VGSKTKSLGSILATHDILYNFYMQYCSYLLHEPMIHSKHQLCPYSAQILLSTRSFFIHIFFDNFGQVGLHAYGVLRFVSPSRSFSLRCRRGWTQFLRFFPCGYLFMSQCHSSNSSSCFFVATAHRQLVYSKESHRPRQRAKLRTRRNQAENVVHVQTLPHALLDLAQPCLAPV